MLFFSFACLAQVHGVLRPKMMMQCFWNSEGVLFGLRNAEKVQVDGDNEISFRRGLVI